MTGAADVLRRKTLVRRLRTVSEPPAPHKPVPWPDSLSAPFWEAANRKELVIQRCQGCGRYHHPPVGVCTTCLSPDQRYVQVSGKGRINTFTITYQARQPAFQAIQPYTVALVELDEQEGLLLYSNIPGSAPGDISIGLPVSVDFEEIVPGIHIPQFRVAS